MTQKTFFACIKKKIHSKTKTSWEFQASFCIHLTLFITTDHESVSNFTQTALFQKNNKMIIITITNKTVCDRI